MMNRYGALKRSNGSAKSQCEDILKQFSVNDKAWAVGMSLVFLRSEQLDALEKQREKKSMEYIVLLQVLLCQ
jgi:myosin heavy subunit